LPQRLEKRSVVLTCFHTLPLRNRSAIQPRRKERSSAQYSIFSEPGVTLQLLFFVSGIRRTPLYLPFNISESIERKWQIPPTIFPDNFPDNLFEH
jgi:hypothetical protein